MCPERQQRISEEYRRRLVDVYSDANPTHLDRIDGLLEKFRGQEHQLYENVCLKYSIKPVLPEFTGQDQEDHQAGASLIGSGFGALQSLYFAADQFREGVERSFDEALRSQAAAEKEPDCDEPVAAEPAPVPETGSGPVSSAEVGSLKAERDNLLNEGIRMSKRLLAVETNAKEARAAAVKHEARVVELERNEAKLQDRVRGLTSRAETAEALALDARADIKRYEKESERLRGELLQEQRALAAEQRKLNDMVRRERALQESTVPEQDLRRVEAALETTARERAELFSVNAQITSELRAISAANSELETRYQRMLEQAEQDSDLQKQRADRVELEYASHSMPYLQKIAELEGALQSYEVTASQKQAEDAQRVEEALAREAAAREELRVAHEQRRAREDEIRAESKKAVAGELAQGKIDLSAVQLAQQSAEQSLRTVEQDLARERDARRANEKRITELLAQLEAQAHAHAKPQAPKVDDAERRLEKELEHLRKQRSSLEQETLQLQERVASLRESAKANSHSALESKFEAALQAIGSLSEELEGCKEERDAFKAQYRALVDRGFEA